MRCNITGIGPITVARHAAGASKSWKRDVPTVNSHLCMDQLANWTLSRERREREHLTHGNIDLALTIPTAAYLITSFYIMQRLSAFAHTHSHVQSSHAAPLQGRPKFYEKEGEKILTNDKQK